MFTFRILLLLLLAGLFSAGCAATPTPTQAVTSAPSCGDGVCGIFEDLANCPQDCTQTPTAGKTLTTFINSEGIGNIAVQVAYPETTRYPEGAGVVVIVSPFFTDISGFQSDPDLTSIGLIQVSYLWPGKTDERTRIQSEGEFDYGGETSMRVLQDVIHFAAGRLADTNERKITALIPVTPLTDEVGLYAFSQAGIAAVNVLALYGDNLPGLQYFIGRENPTVDTLACMEIGHYNDNGQPVENPFYLFPSSYSTHALTVNYGTLRWDPTYTDSHTSFVGRPFLDLDGNNAASAGDHILGWQVPQMFGKRYYSAALTRALLDNGSLSLDSWPADLATPQEAAEAWAFRQSASRYLEIAKLQNADFRVMLVFAQNDHAQVATDKPQIHQAYQGFRFEAQPAGAQLRWVRLNPDRTYVQQLFPSAGADFPDNPANTAPANWLEIGDWAYPGDGLAGKLVPLAAVAEMADRAHTGRWDENLGSTLYRYIPPTPQP